MATEFNFKQRTEYQFDSELIVRDANQPAINLSGVGYNPPDIELIKRIGRGSFLGAAFITIEDFTSIDLFQFAIVGVTFLPNSQTIDEQFMIATMQVGGSSNDDLPLQKGVIIVPFLSNSRNGIVPEGLRIMISGVATGIKFNIALGRRIKAYGG